MQSDCPVDDEIMGALFHIRVHIGICQAEDHRFIAHQRLIMAFYIGNRILGHQ